MALKGNEMITLYSVLISGPRHWVVDVKDCLTLTWKILLRDTQILDVFFLEMFHLVLHDLQSNIQLLTEIRVKRIIFTEFPKKRKKIKQREVASKSSQYVLN